MILNQEIQGDQTYRIKRLIERLSLETGLQFSLSEDSETSFDASLDEPLAFFSIEVEEGIRLKCKWSEEAFPSALSRRLVEALALEIYKDILRDGSQEPTRPWTWEKLIQAALQEKWGTETIKQKVSQYRLPRLDLGYPVYIHCSHWQEELAQVIQLFFPQALVRWFEDPDVFLWIPLEDKGASSSERRIHGESLIQEIHTLLADELGMNSTITIGEPTEGDLWENFLGVRRLLEIHQRFFPGLPGLAAWNLGLALLFSDLKSQTSQRYIQKVMGSLSEDLTETLETFLNHDLSISETAKALFIHRNTLIYRLDRITEFTGYNPRKIVGAVHLYCAVWLMKHQNTSL
jgi:DNA-binding PucR family transcriptional regulator